MILQKNSLKSKRSKLLSIITLILALTIASTMIVTLFSVNSAASATVELFAYITAAPNPAGVNQQVQISFGFTMPTQASGLYTGWKLTITKPDNNTMTKGPFTSDTTGGAYALLVPDQVGTWYLQATYPGGNASYGYVAPHTSEKYALTVQQEPTQTYQEPPLPTDYWTRPVYGENREWYRISGNWLMPAYDLPRVVMVCNGYFNPYTTAPNQSHVLWSKPQLFGGVIGGTAGTRTYYTGSSYRLELAPPIVIGGKLYYNVADPPRTGFYCVDMETGETIWYQNQTYKSATGSIVGGTSAQLTCGQVVIWDTVNQNGGVPYLWALSGNTWARFDAWTGNLLNTIVNCTASNYMVFGENGELLIYYLDANRGTLAMWNSSRVVAGTYSQNAAYNLNWKTGIQWNVTVPTVPGEYISVWDPKNPTILVCSNQSSGSPEQSGAFVDIAYSAIDGHFMWQQTRNEGIWERYLPNIPYGRAMSEGIYTIHRKETRQLYAYDAATGQPLWVTEPRDTFWGTWNGGTTFAYGKIYAAAFDGKIYAYDAKTGQTEWTWSDNSVNPSGVETPYNAYPIYGSVVVADGKVFVANSEHSANSPLYRGERMYAVDASNGQTVWTIDGWYSQPSIVDGKVLAPNGYDGKIYCFGKGKSAITVTAPQTVITKGQSIMITGTITDQSPGQKGTPCVSDENMTAWMEYLHMQKPMPTNIKGVPVKITAIDPNGNFQDIGTVISDIGGSYGIKWTPPVEGTYAVTATFEGTDAYGSSYATTYFGVDPASAQESTPPQTPNPTPTTVPTTSPSPAPPPGGLSLPAEALYAIAAVVVIAVVAVAFLVFRRRK